MLASVSGQADKGKYSGEKPTAQTPSACVTASGQFRRRGVVSSKADVRSCATRLAGKRAVFPSGLSRGTYWPILGRPRSPTAPVLSVDSFRARIDRKFQATLPRCPRLVECAHRLKSSREIRLKQRRRTKRPACKTNRAAPSLWRSRLTNDPVSVVDVA